jgi:hypothetical protein
LAVETTRLRDCSMSRIVGSKSTVEIMCASSTAPALVTPGQRIMSGVRIMARVKRDRGAGIAGSF